MAISPTNPMDSVSNLSPELQKAFQKAVQADRKPIQLLNERKENVQTKVKLLDEVVGKIDNVKKAIPEVASPNRLREVQIISGNDRVVTGVAEKGRANIGNYDIEVMQLAKRASATSNGFPDRDITRAGTGYFSVSLPDGETKELYVDEENSTLDGLAKIVNDARIGLKATVVNERSDPDAPFKLLLTSDAIGEGAQFEYPEFYFVDGEEDFYMENEQPGVNSIIRFQGVDLENVSNEIKGIIPGLTLHLRGVSDGRPTTLNVEQDGEKTTSKVRSFFDGLNQVLSFIQNQNRIDANTNTEKTLGGDYGIRMAESRIRSALQTDRGFTGELSVRALADMGVQFTREGTLKIDEQKLNLAMANHFDQVADLICGDGTTTGVAQRLERAFESVSGGYSSLLTQQRRNFASQADRISKDIESKEKIATRREEDLKNKLNRAQSSLMALQAQSAEMSAQLGAMKGP